MMTFAQRILAILTAAALALAACTSDNATASTPQSSISGADGSTAESGSTPDTNPGATTQPGSAEAGTPTTAFISAAEASKAAAEANAGKQFGGEEFGLSEKQLAERSEAVESAIGKCMASAGFEYIPVDFGTTSRAMSSDKSAPGLSNGEFVAKYGFGISTQFDKPIVELSLGEQNLRIFDGLRDAGKVAYLRTLFGEYTDATFAFAIETENFSRTGGCTRSAVEQFFTPAEMSASYFNPGDAIILTDPRAIQAIADWHQCMVDGGITQYLHPDDVEFSFQRRFDALTKGADVEELAEHELSSLEDLQDDERNVAAVFTDCENNVLDPILNRVENDYYG